MADEITVSVSMSVTNGNFKERFAPGTKKYDQGTAQSAAGVVTVSSDSTTISLGSVSTSAGWCCLTNLSTATEILLGPSTAAFLCRLPQSSSHIFHLVADTSLAVQTTASSADLQYLVLST